MKEKYLLPLVLAVLLFAMFLATDAVAAYTVTKLGESHGLTHHRVRLALDNSGELTDFIKAYDFNVLGAGATNLRFEEVVPIVPIPATTISRECTTFGDGVDKFGFQNCAEWIDNSIVQISPVQPVKEIDVTLASASTTTAYVPKNNKEVPVKKIFSLPQLQVNAGQKIIVDVTWETTINLAKGFAGSSGSWEMNPSGGWVAGAVALYPIKLSGTHQALDFNTTLSLRNFPMSANCIDNNRLALVQNNNGTGVELPIDVVGDCRIQDVNIFYKTPVGIPANTDLNWSDTNGMSIQILDSNVTNPARGIAKVYDTATDFENGATTGYTLTLSNCAGGGICGAINRGRTRKLRRKTVFAGNL